MNNILLTPWQDRMLKKLKHNQFVFIMGGRRIGKTTLLRYITKSNDYRKIAVIYPSVKMGKAILHDEYQSLNLFSPKTMHKMDKDYDLVIADESQELDIDKVLTNLVPNLNYNSCKVLMLGVNKPKSQFNRYVVNLLTKPRMIGEWYCRVAPTTPKTNPHANLSNESKGNYDAKNPPTRANTNQAI